MADVTAPLSGRAEPLIAGYRGLICDLDGVVYRGAAAVPHAVETVARLTADGIPVVFATNNASRPPGSVGDHLRELGLAPGGWSVVTSSQAAAAHLAQRLAPGARVYAVGGPGVAHALTEAGLTAVRVTELDDSQPDGARRTGAARDRTQVEAAVQVEAVVQGLGADVTWTELAAVGRVVEGGARWVATNLDRTLPTQYGKAPGNGALVALVQTATAAEPYVVGKPQADLFDLARTRIGSAPRDTLVCGDLLHTDIEGANTAGLDSLFVLSGSSRLRDLALAEPSLRPTYVATDLSGLLAPGLDVSTSPAAGLLELGPGGVPLLPPANRRFGGDHSGGALLQAVVTTAWAARDEGQPVSGDLGAWKDIERALGLVQPG